MNLFWGTALSQMSLMSTKGKAPGTVAQEMTKKPPFILCLSALLCSELVLRTCWKLAPEMVLSDMGETDKTWNVSRRTQPLLRLLRHNVMGTHDRQGA